MKTPYLRAVAFMRDNLKPQYGRRWTRRIYNMSTVEETPAYTDPLADALSWRSRALGLASSVRGALRLARDADDAMTALELRQHAVMILREASRCWRMSVRIIHDEKRRRETEERMARKRPYTKRNVVRWGAAAQVSP